MVKSIFLCNFYANNLKLFELQHYNMEESRKLRWREQFWWKTIVEITEWKHVALDDASFEKEVFGCCTEQFFSMNWLQILLDYQLPHIQSKVTSCLGYWLFKIFNKTI